MELSPVWSVILGATLPTLINIAALGLAIPSIRRWVDKNQTRVVPWPVTMAIPITYFLVVPFVLPYYPSEWIEVNLNSKGGSIHLAGCMLSWLLGILFVNWRLGLIDIRDL